VATRRRPHGSGISSVLTRPPIEPLDVAVFEQAAATSHGVYDAAKRAFDFVAATVIVLALLPLLALVALLIKIDSRGPVFFRQTRLGRSARPFTMLKFRTMYVNGGDIPPELLAQNEATGPMFKIRRDPRITRTGRWLRRLSLDELPQLFNVLAGQMSLVGPRPPLPRELAGFDKVQRQRLLVLPGLTGLWQVSGRSDLPFDEMVRLDLRYIEERSLLLDLSILLRTLPSVLTGRGAY
jgi:exopolysaccharide biosynthesis polyprenyl glycosylphosphotransferase